MTNLLKETIEKIQRNDKSIDQVKWIGSIDGNFAIKWDEFITIADIEYDSSYGSNKIAMDLVVVADNWWLERHEYDGSEWWEFKEMPHLMDNFKPFKRVTSDDRLFISSILEANQ